MLDNQPIATKTLGDTAKIREMAERVQRMAENLQMELLGPMPPGVSEANRGSDGGFFGDMDAEMERTTRTLSCTIDLLDVLTGRLFGAATAPAEYPEGRKVNRVG